jgi:hypothetical protein
MWFRSRLKSPKCPPPVGGVRRRSARLQAEALENRWLPSFYAPVQYDTGAPPSIVVAGDFNNDTIADVAVTLPGSYTVSVRLGNLDGTFGPAINSSIPTETGAIAAGDFNADGNLDLVMVDNGTNTVSVLSGNGLGGFGRPLAVTIGSQASDLAVGDFNADGRPDLGVVSNVFVLDGEDEYGPIYHFEGYANFLAGLGNGSFAAPATTFLGAGPFFGAAVADLNGDGHLDFAASGRGIQVLFGNGAGGILTGTHVSPEYTLSDVTTADLNGDGRLDLVATSHDNAYEVSVILSTGPGTFGPRRGWTAGSYATSVLTGDFNRDGVTDIATANYYHSTVSVLTGMGDGSFFAPLQFAVGAGPMSLAAGDFNRDGWLDVVTANNDDSLEYPAGYPSDTLSVLINDRSWSPTVPEITISGGSVLEGNIGTATAIYTVSLSAAFNQSVTVAYATEDFAPGETDWYGTPGATAGIDYMASAGTLTFEPGERFKTFTVTVIGDRVGEYPAEAYRIRLSNATNGTIATPVTTGIISDDEPLVHVSDWTSGWEGDVGQTSFAFTVTLTRPYDAAVSVDYATADLTPEEASFFEAASATAGVDYVPAADTLTFAPGETSKTIVVPVIGDILVEQPEMFRITLTDPTHAALLDDFDTGLAFIQDDDALLSIGDVTLTEGHSGTRTATFTVRLSAPRGEPVTVAYATADGTAVANSDYQAVSGTLTFAPGETQKTITVAVFGDQLFEPNETFSVNLSNPTGALITDGTGVGTIVNDDISLPRISISDVTRVEGRNGNTLFVFTVTLSAPSATQVKVSYATADGTARSGEDYEAARGTLTFAPGETTKTITIKVKGDQKVEADETFFVNLSGVSGNVLLFDPQGIGTIRNDD